MDAEPNFRYSNHYDDGTYQYRHVIMPQHYVQYLPKGRLLTETEWRKLGIQQSLGWVHYAYHKPEPHVLLFRRPISPSAN